MPDTTQPDFRSPAADQVYAILVQVDQAMHAENIPDITRRAVINRLVWGDPEGFVPLRRTHA